MVEKFIAWLIGFLTLTIIFTIIGVAIAIASATAVNLFKLLS